MNFTGTLQDGLVTIYIARANCPREYILFVGYTEDNLFLHLSRLGIDQETYNEVAVTNTVMAMESGQTLYHKHYVDRFIEKILHDKETYLD